MKVGRFHKQKALKLFIAMIAALLFFPVYWSAVNAQPASGTVERLRIEIADEMVLLTWMKVASSGEFEVTYRIKRRSGSGVEYITTADTFYTEPFTVDYAFFDVQYLLPDFSNAGDEIIIQDFESGSITLISYSSLEDREPNAWNIATDETFQGSAYSLRVYGNTWKMEMITPLSVQYNTMWGIAVYTYDSPSSSPPEICGFGLGDEGNELFYTFRGSEMADSVHWRTTYHCVGNEDEWIFHFLPVGVDWFNAYGYEPVINRLIYLNDEDSYYSNGGIYFDYICDITEDMPLPPELTVDFEALITYEAQGMSIQFTAEAVDPDSDTLFYHWEFGDGSSTDEQNPIHTFPYMGNFSVQAEVYDETNLFDRQSIEVMVPIGNSNAEITINFTGDCMMGRRYEESWSIIPNYGADAIWEPTLDVLGGGADLTFINFECVLTTNLTTPHPTKEYIFFTRPEHVEALLFAGIDGVTLANNHIMDYMEPALIETHFVLDTAGIIHCGSGLNENEAMQPIVNFSEGISVCNLGYCNRTGRADNLPPFMEAGPNKAGFTWFTEYYLEQTVPQAAALYDIVVAQVHCGIEYATTPDTTLGGDAAGEIWMPIPLEVDSTTLELQYTALDLGADIVVAHHPHVLQGYEVHNGKLIAHSMGNFAFDQNIYETFPSMILYADLNRERIFQCYFRPVYIDDYVPHEATGGLGRSIIDRIADYSRDLNTTVMPYYDDNIAYIALNEEDIIPEPVTRSDTIYFPENSISAPSTSYPMEIYWDGFLTSIDGVSGQATEYAVRFGREMLWMGNFEDEGSTLWDLGSDGATIDNFITYEGNCALKLYRNAYQSSEVSVELEKRFAFDDELYSMCGRIKGINVNNAVVKMSYYTSRYSGGFIETQVISQPLTGTFDWTYFTSYLEIPNNAYYGNIEFHAYPPANDDGNAWFDEIKLIKWEDGWHTLPVEIPQPNNYRFIQIRTNEGIFDFAKVGYTLTKYNVKDLVY